MAFLRTPYLILWRARVKRELTLWLIKNPPKRSDLDDFVSCHLGRARSPSAPKKTDGPAVRPYQLSRTRPAKFANARTLSLPQERDESPAHRRATCALPRPEDLQVALAQLSRAESPNEPRLLPSSVVYFFLGAALGAEACCCFF
jgi:hypothetical protein